jgi:hypothetical protein
MSDDAATRNQTERAEPWKTTSTTRTRLTEQQVKDLVKGEIKDAEPLTAAVAFHLRTFFRLRRE